MNERKSIIDTNNWIISKRGNKNKVSTIEPYAWLVEKERTISGKIENVGTIFLTNKECPFHCLMCDLWKSTVNETVSVGTIPNQIEWALQKMPKVKHLKLYNSGSFFDKNAIPEEEYERIAELVHDFETVIVESHPKFINERVIRFKKLLKPVLQVAIGLETVHPEILPKLNKQMTLAEFEKAVQFLTQLTISSRAFILLRPPFLTEEEGVFWAKKSIDVAFESGVKICTVIPVRAGNGAMDELVESGYFQPPGIQSLEKVLEYGISLKSGLVFADLWNLEIFSTCNQCFETRKERLNFINLHQKITRSIECNC